MKRWMMIAAALFFVRQAQAADMSVIVEATADHPALILVKGQFMKGDDARFSALADAQKTRAIVFLESQGGLAWMGIQIGLAIRRHGFSTAVVDNVQCSSACAVAWMGGKERFMGARSRIGFHAARASMTDQAVASGANAAIGAYLYEIGVTDYKTIIFLTSAPPQEMRWLSLADAIRLKIDVTAFSFLQYQWAWARAALDLKPREPTEPLKQQVTDAAPPKVPAPLPAKRPSQTAPSPSPCEGTEAHVGNEMRCLKPGDSFRDCPDCPEMVVVPAGEFTMGSEQSNDEEPVHKVTIAKPFAAGKFEVTFDNWDACVIAGRCKHLPDDGSWGRGKRPVINVSWDDITKQYLPWLSRETRETYRLLTEAEWEYAARAGSRGKYTWGDEIGSDRANCDGCGSQWDNIQTAPVGSFEANAFNLHDMHGNVWEWVVDCYKDNYANAPSDGKAASERAGCSRVVRGGSWYYGPRNIRAASRIRLTPDARNDGVGFRVARTLDPTVPMP